MNLNWGQMTLKKNNKQQLPNHHLGPELIPTLQILISRERSKGCLFSWTCVANISLTWDQQARFINVIHSNPEVFWLHSEDLVYCNWITHTIPMMTDVPVYLPNHMRPPKIQGEVQKCLDTWLRQGIIRLSKSAHIFWVVIVWKKTKEIHLCINYSKLNSITLQDAFQLPQTEEVLQTIHSSMWFSLWLSPACNGGRWYKKTASRARPSGCSLDFQMQGLISVTLWSGLSVTSNLLLLLYLSILCTFGPSIDHTEIVFGCL